jgi:signal transduction histidine kinase
VRRRWPRPSGRLRKRRGSGASSAAAEQVYADPDQLHRILANILRNAREAIEHQEGRRAKGRIVVSLAKTSEATLVSVRDNGPGVPERVRERLFQPFAGSGRPDSTGLGLAIARELAQAHGGDLSLADTGPGGSTFELRLPAGPAAAKRRPASQAAPK